MSASENNVASGTDTDTDTDVVMIGQDDVSNYNPEHILPQPPKVLQQIRSWLQPTSYDITGGEYRRHLASHLAGTGTWLTSSDTYRLWLDGSEHGLLWIKGIPGSGKSVMAAKLVRDIAASNPGCPVLFFFFRQIIDANHEPVALLRDWMDQLLLYSPPLQKHLLAYVENHRPIDTLSIEDMWRDLRTAFASLPGKVFCIGDALDEMDQGHDTFIKALGALGQWRPETVKVLITSRPVPSVQMPMRNIPCLHLRLEERLVDVDISTYVHFALRNSAIPQSHWKGIADAVPGRANGLFLYAKLAMDAFLEHGADVNTVLSQLPADLNVLYTDLLTEHARRSGVPADTQNLILQSVTHASRPLRLLELADMVRTCGPAGSSRDLGATKDLIRAACGPLLEILADETVSVIHHSFTEYLKGATRGSDSSTGYAILQKGPTHARLALACLRYLQSGCLDTVRLKVIDGDDDDYLDSDYDSDSEHVSNDEAQLRLEHPFFEYAASNWHHHINNSEATGYDQAQVSTELRKFLGHRERMAAWILMRWPRSWPYTKNFWKSVTDLHIAAKTGLVSYTKELLETVDPDIRDVDGKTPLWWAATEGCAAALRVLISAGANPDQADTDGSTPLHQAAEKNHHEIITVLLEAGVDPLVAMIHPPAPGRTAHHKHSEITALMCACQSGHLEAVQAFLPFLEDVDTVHRALAWSASRGRSEVVARILRHPGVNVNVRVGGDTPLYLAVGSRDVATVRLLLQAGADPNAECEHSPDERKGKGRNAKHAGLNSLHNLCGLGPGSHRDRAKDNPDEDIFSLLIQAGVKVNQRTASGKTALHGAVGCSPVLTRLLLDAGADANATDGDGYAPLHLTRSADIVALLVEHGHADINFQAPDGSTPLLLMMSSREETILKFLEYGPNCNAVDKYGNSALHRHLYESGESPGVVRALLKCGADPNLRNHEGLTPLLRMRSYASCPDVILDLLLDNGADINAVNRNGETLLFGHISSSHFGYVEVTLMAVKELVDRGASTSIRDFKGRTILHEEVRTRELNALHPEQAFKSVFNRMVELGLDPKAVDYRGNGLLHEVALRWDNHIASRDDSITRLWEHLLSVGLDLDQKNHAGRTPLHILCAEASNRASYLTLENMVAIDFVISHTKNINVADNDGLTCLHIAATAGQILAKKLLDAGADPIVATQEGLTPLHLACRCRESNVVGLLLDALRKRHNPPSASPPPAGCEALSLSKAAALPGPLIEAKTRMTLTALYYACRSGRPETVALLLEAGADAKAEGALLGCVEFEEEDALWCHREVQADSEDWGTIPLKMTNRTRRGWRLNNWWKTNEVISRDESTRLAEILDMLVEHGADVSALCGSADTAANANLEYTAACLRDALDKSGNRLEAYLDECPTRRASEHFYESLKEASLRALRSLETVKVGSSNREMLRRFLVRREYHLVEELARLGADFLVEEQGYSCNLGILIRHGFASLVNKIGTLAAERTLEKGDWHAFGDRSRPGLWFAGGGLLSNTDKRSHNHLSPFIHQAVRRGLPNMAVVRLLVEKFGVDVNEREYTWGRVGGERTVVAGGSALHATACGDSWWSVYQALPYLVKAGADLESRGVAGQTPLHMALGATTRRPGIFGREAARLLIEAGADVNAVDDEGRSCVARAKHDIEMTRFLIDNGATVTADALFAAIDDKNVDVLRVLLSSGVDANIRRGKNIERDSMEGQRKRRRYDDKMYESYGRMERHEEYPLFRAGMGLQVSKKKRWGAPDPDLGTQFQIVQVLLDHGADPFATFHRQVLGEKLPQECTILHELLLAGRLADAFLDAPGLDVNRRDSKGRTLLHAACRGRLGADHVIGTHEYVPPGYGGGRISYFQRLVSLGADMRARDDEGRNILHHMIGEWPSDDKKYEGFKDSLAHVLGGDAARELIGQATSGGRTPLHCAAACAADRGSRDPRVVRLLLEAGADARRVDAFGNTVLHALAANLETEDLRALFRDLVVVQGVNINARNRKGQTPLFTFAWRHRDWTNHSGPRYAGPEEDGEEYTERGAAAMLGELGADFLATDNAGMGLLHVAATGCAERFGELVGVGLDPMAEDERHRTAVDIAAARGNKEILVLFEEKDTKGSVA